MFRVQYSCLENPMDRGAWWALVHEVTKSRVLVVALRIFGLHFTMGTFYLWHVGSSSPTRDRTWTSSHWTTMEVPLLLFQHSPPTP